MTQPILITLHSCQKH